MAKHPLVLLVEPNPLVRRLIHGEIKDQGCVVFDAANETDALAFAAVYPGSIDLVVTDLPVADQPNRNHVFTRTLRSLPAGTQARILHMSATSDSAPRATTSGPSYLMKPFDRQSLIAAVRQALPANHLVQAEAEQGEKAVFWGAAQTDDAQVAAL